MVNSWLKQKWFSKIHQSNLVYNTCWEDPRLDRQALTLSESDRVMVITSAGCNALDYALDAPARVHAVDMNRLQNALLELKIASIRALHYEDFFHVFGCGVHPEWRSLYRDAIRPILGAEYQEIWDKRSRFFDGTSKRSSFYFRGTTGFFAWLINGYLKRPPGLREAIEEILAAETVEAQKEVFHGRNVDQLLWNRSLRWVLRRDSVMTLLGVPKCQRQQIERVYPGGIAEFIQDRVRTVFTRIPLHDNYFWRVYLTGRYTHDCCPEYLKQENYSRLKGLVDRITTHTDTVQGFLETHEGRISRFVLLDHMDWLYKRRPELLAAEWQSILSHAAPSSRALWRSASMEVDFVDPLVIRADGASRRLGELLSYQKELASDLHARDRVHTYGSFCIADFEGAAA